MLCHPHRHLLFLVCLSGGSTLTSCPAARMLWQLQGREGLALRLGRPGLVYSRAWAGLATGGEDPPVLQGALPDVSSPLQTALLSVTTWRTMSPALASACPGAPVPPRTAPSTSRCPGAGSRSAAPGPGPRLWRWPGWRQGSSTRSRPATRAAGLTSRPC